jgi:hypothetical protein
LTLPAGQGGPGFARRLRELPPEQRPAPALNLAITLHNDGPRAVEVRLGGPEAELDLDVRGPGVLRLPGPEPRRPVGFLFLPGKGSAPGWLNRLPVPL